MKLNNPFSSFGNYSFQFVKKAKNMSCTQQAFEGSLKFILCTIRYAQVFSALSTCPCRSALTVPDEFVHTQHSWNLLPTQQMCFCLLYRIGKLSSAALLSFHLCPQSKLCPSASVICIYHPKFYFFFSDMKFKTNIRKNATIIAV